MGDFLESYAKLLDLNVWTDSTLKSSDYDPSSKQWTVTIERGKAGGNAEIRKLALYFFSPKTSHYSPLKRHISHKSHCSS